MSNITIKGIHLIAEERSEQINKHGRTIASDFQQNENGQLAIGAMMLLAVDFEEGIDSASYPQGWDHDLCAKMLAKNYKDRLVMAGALIAAEIDRIQFIPA